MRNTIAHEYPDSVDQTVDALNSLFKEWKVLESMYYGVKDYYVKRVVHG